MLDLTKYLWPNFHCTDFHVNYYQVLDLFCKKKIKRLIITIPPQHGKSQGSSKYAPANIFGHYPNSNIALMSYSTTFARKFNRHLQRLMDSQEYKDVFPSTRLNDANVTTVSRGYLRNADEFEIVGTGGSFKVIGREGSLTGNPVDVLIFDDLYKDSMEGNSPVIRDNVIEMYKSVAETRLHNDSQEICVFTRWHEEDLIGWFEKNFNVITINSIQEIEAIKDWSNVWVKVNYEAIKENEPTELDSRQIGEPLYPERHSLQLLSQKQLRDPIMFNCMYQGNPQPKEGLLYQPFKTYSILPENVIKKANYTDTADEGDCYLCSISYSKTGDNTIYVTDIVYTKEGMEKTEETVPLMLQRTGTKIAYIESNNGGRGFARNIQRNISSCVIEPFTQVGNKESRILTNAPQVNNILLPIDWRERWPDFYTHVVTFKRLFKANKYKDAPDVLTGIVEKEAMNIVPIIW